MLSKAAVKRDQQRKAQTLAGVHGQHSAMQSAIHGLMPNAAACGLTFTQAVSHCKHN
jgi:hypothetical protein